MTVLQNINKSFGSKQVLADFSVAFEQGSRTCIMGVSGGGKTTVLNILMGLIKPDSGSIFNPPKKISAVFQEDRLCEPYSAVKNIFAVTGKLVSEEKIIAMLGDLGLSGSEHIAVKSLSGGMRRRVALARALLAESEMVILDEPFKGLDEETRERVIDVLLRNLNGRTLIVATHDARDVTALNADVVNVAMST